MKSRGCWIPGRGWILVGGRGPRAGRPVRNAEYRDYMESIVQGIGKRLVVFTCIYLRSYTRHFFHSLTNSVLFIKFYR